MDHLTGLRQWGLALTRPETVDYEGIASIPTSQTGLTPTLTEVVRPL